jgi:hypothetical protein
MPYPFFDHLHHNHRAHNLFAERLLAQQLERAQGGPRVGQELGVLRAAPVLQVVEVGDELGLVEDVVAGEVVEIPRVAEQLDDLGGVRRGCGVGRGRTSSSSSKRVKPP